MRISDWSSDVCSSDLVVPDPGREAVRRVVGLLDRLRGRAEGQHREHRAEDLLAGDPVGLGDAGAERRSEPEPVAGPVAGRGPAPGALLPADLDELLDPGQMGLRLYPEIGRETCRERGVQYVY